MKAIAPGVTCFTPHKWPTVAVDGDLLAESDELPNKIERSIYRTCESNLSVHQD